MMLNYIYRYFREMITNDDVLMTDLVPFLLIILSSQI